MNTLSRTFNLLSVIALSFFSGAFLFIGFVVVKFWQSIAPATFLDWMSDAYLSFPMPKISLSAM